MAAALRQIQESTKAGSVALFQHDEQLDQLRLIQSRGGATIELRGVNERNSPLKRCFVEQKVSSIDRKTYIPLWVHRRGWGCLLLAQQGHRFGRHAIEQLQSYMTAVLSWLDLKTEHARKSKDLAFASNALRVLEARRTRSWENLTNELIGPVSSLRLSLKLLSQQLENGETSHASELLSNCERLSNRVSVLFQESLLASRLQQGAIPLDEPPISLKRLIQAVCEALTPIAASAQAILKVEPFAECFVKGNFRHLLMAFSTVVEQAIHLSKRGDTVTIRLKQTGQPYVNIEVMTSRKVYCTSERLALFEFNLSEKKRSQHSLLTRWQLWNVRQTLWLHGGAVNARIEEGRECFAINLPIYASQLSATSSQTEAQNGTILLVEDDLDCLRILSQLLQFEGFPTVGASSVREAIDELTKQMPALILLDLKLGNESGIEVLDFLSSNAKFADVPVYLVSGIHESEALSQIPASGRIKRFFSKPICAEKLLDAVSQMVLPRP